MMPNAGQCRGRRFAAIAVGEFPARTLLRTGTQHSAFISCFPDWVTNRAATPGIVMGFDARICVRGMFRDSDWPANVLPPSLVPARGGGGGRRAGGGGGGGWGGGGGGGGGGGWGGGGEGGCSIC